MKKLLLSLIFVFVTLFSFSQEWVEVPDFTNLLWVEYGLDVETYFEERSGYIGFVDYEVQDSVYMTRIISYLLSSIEDFLWYERGLLFEESSIDGLLYIVEVRADFFSKAGATRDIEIEIDRNWMLQYYSSSSRRRNQMIMDLVSYYF